MNSGYLKDMWGKNLEQKVFVIKSHKIMLPLFAQWIFVEQWFLN